MNVNSPSLILSQISDAFSYHDVLLKLQIFNPSEVSIKIIYFFLIYNTYKTYLYIIRNIGDFARENKCENRLALISHVSP